MAMRVAHFSDLHLLSLEGARLLDFANKRWIGGLNLLANRGRHYHTEVFEALVRDVNQQGVDHCICTGISPTWPWSRSSPSLASGLTA